jgi:hypothetical protein
MKDKTAATWAECYTARPLAGTVVVAPNKAKAANFQAFSNKFKENFKEHNKGETTCLLLSKLKQGKYSVDTYNNTFNNYAADTNYNNEVLRFMYMQGLNESIHGQIMLMSVIPTTLHELQDKASESMSVATTTTPRLLIPMLVTMTIRSLDRVPTPSMWSVAMSDSVKMNKESFATKTSALSARGKDTLLNSALIIKIRAIARISKDPSEEEVVTREVTEEIAPEMGGTQSTKRAQCS